MFVDDPTTIWPDFRDMLNVPNIMLCDQLMTLSVVAGEFVSKGQAGVSKRKINC